MADDKSTKESDRKLAHPWPFFRHIHCSSRFDRSPAQLEADIDDWMSKCSVITMTEVGNDQHAAQLAEKGWGYHYTKGGGGDDGGIAWRLDTWKGQKAWAVKLNARTPERAMASAMAIIKHRDVHHTLLISVAHMPAHVMVNRQGKWGTWEAHWQARKKAYQEGMKSWSSQVRDAMRKYKPDAVLVVADWNQNLKNRWFQDYLDEHWGENFRMAWRRFPTEGGSRFGNQVVPLAAPGKGHGDTIIDGSLYHGLEVAIEPNLMHAVRSSDHRPYMEGFWFNHAAGTPANDGAGLSASGDTKPGPAWWGFGDYIDDELYQVDNGGVPYFPDLYRATGSKEGEVL